MSRGGGPTPSAVVHSKYQPPGRPNARARWGPEDADDGSGGSAANDAASQAI